MTPEQEKKWFGKQMRALHKFEKASLQAKPIIVTSSNWM